MDNGHSWLDGSGNIGSAVWSATVNTNDTLTITLSVAAGVPTVAPGDTVTLSANLVKNESGSILIISSGAIGGSFAPNPPAAP